MKEFYFKIKLQVCIGKEWLIHALYDEFFMTDSKSLNFNKNKRLVKPVFIIVLIKNKTENEKLEG